MDSGFLLDLFRGWSWEEIARVNELGFMGVMTLAAVWAAGVLGITL